MDDRVWELAVNREDPRPALVSIISHLENTNEALFDNLWYLKVYLVSKCMLGESDTLTSKLSTMIKNKPSIQEWTVFLRPYFEDPKISRIEPSTLLRHHLSNGNMLDWDQEFPWRQISIVKDLVLECIKCSGSVFKMEEAAKILPFVIRLSDDTDQETRVIGSRCIRAYLLAVDVKIIQQIQVDVLFKDILLKNLAFDTLILKEESVRTLLDCLYIKSPFACKQEWVGDLLAHLIRESSFAIDESIVTLYTRCIVQCINILGIETVCYLSLIIPFCVEISEKPTLQSFAIDLIKTLEWSCGPRLYSHRHLLTIAIDRLSAIEPSFLNLRETIRAGL